MDMRLIISLVALTLPGLSQQTPPDCSTNGYVDRDVTVAFEVSEPLRDFVGGAPGQPTIRERYAPMLRQIGLFYEDVFQAFGATPRVNVVYMSNDVTRIQSSLTSPQLLNGNSSPLSWPKIPSDSGSYLRNNLLAIVNQLQGTPRRAKPMYLIAIYAVPLSSTHVQDVSNYINQLQSNQNIFVRLIAVDSAVNSPSFNQLTAALNGGSETIIYSSLNSAGIGQQITNIAIVCNPSPPVVRDDECSNCQMVHGVGKTSHADCDKFVVCIQRGNRIQAIIKQCQYGTLYDETKTACVHAKDRVDSCNWCSREGQRHRFQDNCRAYWVCNSSDTNRISARCCPPGQSFNNETEQCELGGSCAGSSLHIDPQNCHSYYQCNQASSTLDSVCCPDGQSFHPDSRQCVNNSLTYCRDSECAGPRTFSCESQRIDECNYLEVTGESKRCPDGTTFSTSSCMCDWPQNNEQPCLTSREGRAGSVKCDGNILIESTRNVLNGPIVNSEGVTDGANNVGVYSGTGGLVIPFFKANRYATAKGVYVQQSFNLDSTTGTQVLLSNKACDGSFDGNLPPSIFAYTTPSSSSVTVGLRLLPENVWFGQESDLSVTLNADSALFQSNGYKTLTFVFDGFTLKAQLSINGVVVDGEASTGEAIKREIAARSCNWRIGFEEATAQSDFSGTMNNVDIRYQCYQDLELNSSFVQ